MSNLAVFSFENSQVRTFGTVTTGVWLDEYRAGEVSAAFRGGRRIQGKEIFFSRICLKLTLPFCFL